MITKEQIESAKTLGIQCKIVKKTKGYKPNVGDEHSIVVQKMSINKGKCQGFSTGTKNCFFFSCKIEDVYNHIQPITDEGRELLDAILTN